MIAITNKPITWTKISNRAGEVVASKVPQAENGTASLANSAAPQDGGWSGGSGISAAAMRATVLAAPEFSKQIPKQAAGFNRGGAGGSAGIQSGPASKTGAGPVSQFESVRGFFSKTTK